MVMARKRVLVQLDDELLERLDEVARQTGQNRSELLRPATRALVFHYENVEEDLRLIEGHLRQPQEPELLEWMAAIQQETFRATEWSRGGDLVWAGTGGPEGGRPVWVLTRDSAIGVLERVVCAVVTSTIRGIASEVEVGPEHGPPTTSVIHCDTLVTVPTHRLDPVPLGRLDLATRAELDRTLAYSLDLLF